MVTFTFFLHCNPPSPLTHSLTQSVSPPLSLSTVADPVPSSATNAANEKMRMTMYYGRCLVQSIAHTHTYTTDYAVWYKLHLIHSITFASRLYVFPVPPSPAACRIMSLFWFSTKLPLTQRNNNDKADMYFLPKNRTESESSIELFHTHRVANHLLLAILGC